MRREHRHHISGERNVSKNKFQSFWFASARHIIIPYELRLAFIYCPGDVRWAASLRMEVHHSRQVRVCGGCARACVQWISVRAAMPGGASTYAGSSNCKPNKFNYIKRSWHSLLSFSTKTHSMTFCAFHISLQDKIGMWKQNNELRGGKHWERKGDELNWMRSCWITRSKLICMFCMFRAWHSRHNS